MTRVVSPTGPSFLIYKAATFSFLSKEAESGRRQYCGHRGCQWSYSTSSTAVSKVGSTEAQSSGKITWPRAEAYWILHMLRSAPPYNHALVILYIGISHHISRGVCEGLPQRQKVWKHGGPESLLSRVTEPVNPWKIGDFLEEGLGMKG